MKTAYKPSLISPFHMMTKKALDTQNKDHPIQEEIHKSLGTFTFSATFERDTHSLEIFKNIPGIVCYICTLRKGDQVIGEGRGTAVLGKVNKYLERTVRYAFNSSLIDAVARSTKMIDALYLDGPAVEEEMKVVENPITDKQKSYLTELIKNNVDDEGERNRWMLDIPKLSKDEASEAIQSFAN